MAYVPTLLLWPKITLLKVHTVITQNPLIWPNTYIFYECAVLTIP